MVQTVKNITEGKLGRQITLIVEGGREINGILSEERVTRKKDTMEKCLYDIRHSDNDWCDPATLERQVLVNWFGTIILDTPIEFPEGQDYLEIEDYDIPE